MNLDKIRLDLTIQEYEYLQKLMNETVDKNYHSFNTLNEKIQEKRIIKHSVKKSNATEIATKAREKKAKEKIENAINILRMEDKKITVYSVAKMAEVSYNTAKKYEDIIISNG